MSDHDQLEPWQRKMMYRDDGHHRVTKNYNTGFYRECQQGSDDDEETQCDACEKYIEENCIYWCTVTEDKDPVMAAEPDRISNSWYCRHQGVWFFLY